MPSEIAPGSIAHRREAFGGILIHVPTERMLLLSAPQYEAAAGLIDGTVQRDLIELLARRHQLVEPIAVDLIGHTSATLSEPQHFTATPILLRNFADGLSAPLNLVWEITGRCNLRCQHCFMPREEHAQNDLQVADLLRIADIVVEQNVPIVRISGGEPMLHPALAEILTRLKSTPRHVKLVTNATSVDDRSIALVRHYVDSLSVSLDGATGARHDRIRGREGVFERTYKGLRRLREETRARVNVTTSVFRDNVDEVPAIIDLCLGLGVDTWKYTLVIPIGRARTDPSLLPREDTMAALARVLEPYRAVPMVAPALELLDDYLDPVPKPTSCGGAFDEVAIDPMGHLYPCAYMSGLRRFDAGDVLETEFGALYHSRTFHGFRQPEVYDLSPDCKAVRSAYFGGVNPRGRVYDPTTIGGILSEGVSR